MKPRLCFLVRVMKTLFLGFLDCFFIFLRPVFQKQIEFRVGKREGRGGVKEVSFFLFLFLI